MSGGHPFSADRNDDQVYLSPFFLQKGFSLITGYGLGEYIRNRRLHNAALDLKETEDKVIDIALRYCYETPESFSKAYISFIAAVSSDRCQMVKLYPEGEAEARFKICGVRRICFYCNRDGLFSQDVVKGIDDKESGYDDTQERRELEQAADMLFG